MLCGCNFDSIQNIVDKPENTAEVSTSNNEDADTDKDAKTEIEVETSTIETEYGEIAYPKSWRDKVKTETTETEDGACCVTFYGDIDGHGSVKLFDIIYGGSEGTPIGSVEKNGEKVGVYATTYDPEFDKTWSDDDRMTVISMQEDINVLIDSINN